MAGKTDILVRASEPTDFAAASRIFSGPKSIWGTFQVPFTSAEVWRKLMSDPPPGIHAMVAERAGEVVGQLALETFPGRPRRKHVGRIGMAVADEHQGVGVGSALMAAATDLADRWLDLMRLELEVFVDNERAIALYRKVGFEVEGTLRKYAFRDGEFVDCYGMARLREQPG